MTVFPAHLADAATAAGLRLSAFEWIENDMPGREAASGTAVVGDVEQLKGFERTFVADRIGIDGAVRTLLTEPDSQTTESVLYCPGYHLDDETEQM
jgi:hypothetical protein